MKKAGFRMGALMSVTMGLLLTGVGLISSGHFTVPAFITSFLLSVVVALLIGVIIPMPKINQGLARKFQLVPGSMKARAIETLVSDAIYTPIMTFVMVTRAWFQIRRMGEGVPPYVPMLLKELLIGFVLAYLVIFLVTPHYTKLAMHGVTPPDKPEHP